MRRSFYLPLVILTIGLCVGVTTLAWSQPVPGSYIVVLHVAGGVALYLADTNIHPKPTSTTGVLAVRDALKAAGECPDGTTYSATGCVGSAWTGDPDGTAEPLLNVAGF